MKTRRKFLRDVVGFTAMALAGSSVYATEQKPDDGVGTPAYDFKCTKCGAYHGGVYSRTLCANCYIKYPWLRNK